MQPPPEAKPQPNLDVSSRVVDGEVVVLDHANERIHQLNATASFIWSRLDGTRRLDQVAAELTRNFSVDEEIALADVHRVVAELSGLGLLSFVHSSGAEAETAGGS